MLDANKIWLSYSQGARGTKTHKHEHVVEKELCKCMYGSVISVLVVIVHRCVRVTMEEIKIMRI